MRAHLPALDHGRMDPAPAPYMTRINGHPAPPCCPLRSSAAAVLATCLSEASRANVPAGVRHLGVTSTSRVAAAPAQITQICSTGILMQLRPKPTQNGGSVRVRRDERRSRDVVKDVRGS